MIEKVKLEKPQSVEEFQKMSRYIYHDLNTRKYKEDKDLIARLIEEITRLMEHARKDKRAAFREQLAHIFSWSMAVANRLDINIQEALWYKYPGVCPYCLKEKDCICGTEHPVVEGKELILRRLRRERVSREPRTLSEHQLLHRRLYIWQHEREFPIIVVAHLVEEAGEVSEAHRHFIIAKENKDWAEMHRQWDNVCEEMSDVFSWMFTLSNRMEFDLADAVWEYYPYECVECHQGPCVCKKVI